MRHHVFTESATGYYKVALLIKGTAFNKQELMKNYVDPLIARGIPADQIIAFTLAYNDDGKAPVSLIKAYLEDLLQTLWELGVSHLYVADGNYFKVLAKQSKAEAHLGYILPCLYKEFHAPETFKVCLGLNHQALIYNPDLQAKLDLSLDALASDLGGSYQALGADIIHSCWYPEDVRSIAHALDSLHQYPTLTCDIETFSLRFNEAGVGTCAFAWDQHNGLAFCCDWFEYAERPTDEFASHYGYQQANHAVRGLLKQFFTDYKGKLIWHNAGFDVKIKIATLWMEDLLDRKGLMKGLEILTRNIEDTKIIAYLATNSCAGNSLGLKALAHEFAGNWAVEEIKDIRRLPKDKLLQYNLVDCLSTWYVFNKYYPMMVADDQEYLYLTMMLPSLKTILQMELIGMPMDTEMIAKAKAELEAKEAAFMAVFKTSPTIQEYNLVLRQKAMEKANAKLKKKQHPLSAFDHVELNPNSGPQLQGLLYEHMRLPEIDYTDTGLPATGADTLEKLTHRTSNPEYLGILNALIGLAKVSKILSAFIPNFEAAVRKGDGIQWLHGSFNIGGTVSGRLSSSEPNLQQIPSGSDYGKLIKSCFKAPKGWIFAGADFNSLEDYISALTTKDPNKLNVYLQGFDGHCLRAAYYFRDELPHIDLNDPASVNSIKKTAPHLRQDSKAPTFALTYQGTAYTLMSNLGWSEDKAKSVEANYHELYKVSDQYVQDRLRQASKDGYVEVAFGLRVRTPLLKQVLFGSRSMPPAAAAEGRTAGNALGQSYGLLNNRAAIEFQNKVWASKHRYDVFLVALIHDATYLIMRDDIEVVEWVNRELIKSMQWQELPEIQHDQVKLGAALDLFWPDWAHPITLPNGADQETIIKMCQEAQEELKQAA